MEDRNTIWVNFQVELTDGHTERARCWNPRK
jgi:hypothetical protein